MIPPEQIVPLPAGMSLQRTPRHAQKA